MTISERIFERLKQIHMTQKEFAGKAGIKESAISEWKKNKTNPSSDKILAICTALEVTPEWLLSGVDPAASRGKNHQFYVVEADTDSGMFLNLFNQLDDSQREKLYEYMNGLSDLETDDRVKARKAKEAEDAGEAEKAEDVRNTEKVGEESNSGEAEKAKKAEKPKRSRKAKKAEKLMETEEEKPSKGYVRYEDNEPDEFDDDDDEIAAMFGGAF